MNSLLSKSILEMDQFIVERVNINQSNVLSRRVWLFTLSPDKQNLLLFSNQPIQLKTRSACVLVAGTQRNFFTSLSRWGTLVSWSSTNQGGPRPCPRKAHFWTCKIRMKQWKTFLHIWAQLSWDPPRCSLRPTHQSPTASSWACCSPLHGHVGLRQEGHLTLESGKDQVSFMPLDHL